METYIFENDLKVFGTEVKDFPNGIDNAFNELIKKTGDGAGKRNYYGLSSVNSDGKIIYTALAEEKNNNEASKYNYKTYTIEKGEYCYTELKNWRSNTNCIKDIFCEMLKDKHINNMKPCIEWYKNDEEMWCMMRSL